MIILDKGQGHARVLVTGAATGRVLRISVGGRKGANHVELRRAEIIDVRDALNRYLLQTFEKYILGEEENESD